jgi:lipopolysaccharide biosynthesis glycosyltransferase
LTSIFQNNQKNVFHFHVIVKGISNEEKTRIKEFVQKHHGAIFFYSVSEALLKDFSVPKDPRYSTVIYYRFFFQKLVPAKVERLLFIDVDTLVIGKLKPLFDLNLGDKPVAAVIDIATESRPDLNISDKTYFNAGVMLINQPEWERQEISEKSIQFLKEFPDTRWLDQDALNVALQNKWYRLPDRYNIQFHHVPTDLAKENYKSFLEDKVIIHYSLEHKPWNILGKNKLRYLYHDFLRKSPQKNNPKYNNFKLSFGVIFAFLKIRLREKILNFPGIFKFLRSSKQLFLHG